MRLTWREGLSTGLTIFFCIKDVPFFPDYEISYVFTQKEKKIFKEKHEYYVSIFRL